MKSEAAGPTEQDFPKYARYGSKFRKALDTVANGGVKEHRFLPSGRTVFTVVGQTGDEFIDPEKPYCSCSNFYFRVMGRREELCYHLLSYRMASESKSVDVVTFSDEEYDAVLSAILRDVFRVLDRSKS